MSTENFKTGARCALCGRYLRIVDNLHRFVQYCPGCGIEFPPAIDGYDRREDYISKNERFEFSYHARGHWMRWDMLTAETKLVEEAALPGDLVLKSEWQKRKAERERIFSLFGEVEQLHMALDVVG